MKLSQVFCHSDEKLADTLGLQKSAVEWEEEWTARLLLLLSKTSPMPVEVTGQEPRNEYAELQRISSYPRRGGRDSQHLPMTLTFSGKTQCILGAF